MIIQSRGLCKPHLAKAISLGMVYGHFPCYKGKTEQLKKNCMIHKAENIYRNSLLPELLREAFREVFRCWCFPGLFYQLAGQARVELATLLINQEQALYWHQIIRSCTDLHASLQMYLIFKYSRNQILQKLSDNLRLDFLEFY